MMDGGECGCARRPARTSMRHGYRWWAPDAPGNGGVLTPQACVQRRPSTGFGYRHMKEGAAIVEEVQQARQRYGNLSANSI